MIKRIGTEARHDLEQFFGRRVFLDLRVKVNADWRDNERVLDDIGVPKSEGKARTSHQPRGPRKPRAVRPTRASRS